MNLDRSRILDALVALLVVAVGVQAFFLFQMDRRLGELTSPPEREAVALTPSAPLDPLEPLDPDAWDPFEEMRLMQQRVDRVFDEAFGRFGASPRFGALARGLAFAPKIDVDEEPERFVVRVDVPGADLEEIDVTVDGRVLTVAGSRSVVRRDETADVLHHERRFGEFRRSLTLPEDVDEAGLETTYEDGILTIVLPKLLA